MKLLRYRDGNIIKPGILDNTKKDYRTYNRFKTNYKTKLSDLFNVNDFNNETTFEIGLSIEDNAEKIDNTLDIQPFLHDYSNKIEAIYFKTKSGSIPLGRLSFMKISISLNLYCLLSALPLEADSCIQSINNLLCKQYNQLS